MAGEKSKRKIKSKSKRIGAGWSIIPFLKEAKKGGKALGLSPLWMSNRIIRLVRQKKGHRSWLFHRDDGFGIYVDLGADEFGGSGCDTGHLAEIVDRGHGVIR